MLCTKWSIVEACLSFILGPVALMSHIYISLPLSNNHPLKSERYHRCWVYSRVRESKVYCKPYHRCWVFSPSPALLLFILFYFFLCAEGQEQKIFSFWKAVCEFETKWSNISKPSQTLQMCICLQGGRGSKTVGHEYFELHHLYFNIYLIYDVTYWSNILLKNLLLSRDNFSNDIINFRK